MKTCENYKFPRMERRDRIRVVTMDDPPVNTVTLPMHEQREILRGLLKLEKPVTAHVNGHAMGVGATLAVFSDVSFMIDKARIADTHVKVGLSAGDGGDGPDQPRADRKRTGREGLCTGRAPGRGRDARDQRDQALG